MLTQADKDGGFAVLPKGTYNEKALAAVNKNFAPVKKSEVHIKCKAINLLKRATWADTIKGSGGATSTGKKNTAAEKTRGEAQSEHVNDPRIQSLEAENLQLKRELAELKEALNSIREQFSHRDEDKFKVLSPLVGKPKRKAPYPGTVSKTDSEDEMAEPSEDTAAAAIPPAKIKTRGKLASIEKTLGCMMEMLSGMETRLTQLERPKVQAKSRLTATTIPTQADPNPGSRAKGLLDHLQ
ncbi:hypothetical protein HPB50_028769 [Hyalomma asiaticum]|nr:hypothetical protein HPB50_028769 [Hyalomma asiaticum]